MAAQMLHHIAEQSRHIGEQGKQIDFQAHTIKLRDIRIERITHELARLKAWRFGARTEETLAADQASL
jgi:transposase